MGTKKCKVHSTAQNIITQPIYEENYLCLFLAIITIISPHMSFHTSIKCYERKALEAWTLLCYEIHYDLEYDKI